MTIYSEYSKMAEHTGEEELNDTLPNASTDHDDPELILLDSSLPDASTDNSEDNSFNLEDVSLPDASLDISHSGSVDLDLGKDTFVR